MRRNLFFALICLLTGAILSACGSSGSQPESESDVEATTTQIAAEIFATQTAEAPVKVEIPPTETKIKATPTNTPVPATDTPTATIPPPTPTVEETEESSVQTGDTLNLADTPTPVPTDTPTAMPTPSARVIADMANLRSGPDTDYAIVGQSQQGDTLPVTGRDGSPPAWWQVLTADGQEAWVSADLVEVSHAEQVAQVAAPPPPPATPIPSQQWVLVADSATDFPGPIQDRKWWYLWSKGRNNFIWQDMTETPDCYRSPNEMTLAICRDLMTVDTCDAGERPGLHCSRGDAALQWKAREGGTYRFEWDSSEVDDKTTLWFYKHLDFVGSQGPGSELPYSAIVEDVIEWELFFWVPQYDTPYQVKVYKLQE